MKRAGFFLLLFLTITVLWAQQKYALVIGNGAYTGIRTLRNPVNDANDMRATLLSLGFNDVAILSNGTLEQMESAILNFVRRLSASRNAYGFFFYAGHGVQANGENYLIPVDAGSIQSDSQLRLRTVSVQSLLDDLSKAGNELNMIVLDACRDNPFGWARSGSRGLSVVEHPPSDSIIMYATAPNTTADDNPSGSNGLFTGQLLSNLRTPGLSVFKVFDKTMGDVSRITNGIQRPELYLSYSGADSIYFTRPEPPPGPGPVPGPIEPIIPPVPPNSNTFIGTWIATVQYNNSYDTYEISFAAGNRCTVRIYNGTVIQETTGSWLWDGTFFKLTALFRDAKIPYQNNIQWNSVLTFAEGSDVFYILGTPASDGPLMRFTFIKRYG